MPYHVPLSIPLKAMLYAVTGMGVTHGRHRATVVKMVIAAAVTATTMLLVQNWGSIFNPTPRPVHPSDHVTYTNSLRSGTSPAFEPAFPCNESRIRFLPFRGSFVWSKGT